MSTVIRPVVSTLVHPTVIPLRLRFIVVVIIVTRIATIDIRSGNWILRANAIRVTVVRCWRWGWVVCDFEEVCDGSSDSCPEDKTADDGVDCGNNLQCASGICTSLNQQCRQSGNSMNLTEACGQKNDESCVVSCRDPSNRSVSRSFLHFNWTSFADDLAVTNVSYCKLPWWMDHLVVMVVTVTMRLVKLGHGKIDSRRCTRRTSRFRSQ